MIKSYGNDNIFSNFKFGDGDLENKERAYNQKFQGIKKNIDKNEKLITELGDFDNEMEFNSSAQALFDINASIETISTGISNIYYSYYYYYRNIILELNLFYFF